MARIFAGNEALVDPEVFEAVKHLSNEFFVFAEFDIDRRNIDWLIIRTTSGSADDTTSSAAILTELKRVSAPITGTVQDEWRVERIDGTIETVGGGQEKNPYWQAVSAANALRSWLWNHHRLFCDDASDGGERQESSFSVWPDVLLLPRHQMTIEHRLPVRPTNGFGMWWFDLDRWLHHVKTWRPNQRDRTRRFTESELLRLAGLFDTHEVHDGRTDAPPARRPDAPIASVPDAVDDADSDYAIGPVLHYFQTLEEKIASLSARVAELEAHRMFPEVGFPDQLPEPDRNGAERDVSAPEPSPARAGVIPVEQAEVIAEIARAFALAGRRAVFPAVLKDVERRLGASLKKSNYNGLGSARAFFDKAQEEGIIQYGPDDESGAPTILPATDEPEKRPQRRSRS